MFWINPYSQRNQRQRWIWPLEEAKAQEAVERQALQRELAEVRREWEGARRIEPAARYDGAWYKREDGSVFGLRLSGDHGLTLDVIESVPPLIANGFRIHQR